MKKTHDLDALVFPRVIASGVVILIGLAGCADQTRISAGDTVSSTSKAASVTDKKALADDRAERTIKSGASVAFSYVLDAVPAVGAEGTVTLTIDHDYRDATIALSATGDDGLSVAGATAAKTVYVFEPGRIGWELRFTPTAPGPQYINLFATVSKTDGYQSARTYAIRIDRDGSTREKPSGSVTEVIMQADETITN